MDIYCKQIIHYSVWNHITGVLTVRPLPWYQSTFTIWTIPGAFAGLKLFNINTCIANCMCTLVYSQEVFKAGSNKHEFWWSYYRQVWNTRTEQFDPFKGGVFHWRYIGLHICMHNYYYYANNSFLCRSLATSRICWNNLR